MSSKEAEGSPKLGHKKSPKVDGFVEDFAGASIAVGGALYNSWVLSASVVLLSDGDRISTSAFDSMGKNLAS
jgi:hypothetical protein